MAWQVRVVGSHSRDGNMYTLDYTHFPTKGGGAGLLEGIAKVGKEHKVALACALATASRLLRILPKSQPHSAATDADIAGMANGASPSKLSARATSRQRDVKPCMELPTVQICVLHSMFNC